MVLLVEKGEARSSIVGERVPLDSSPTPNDHGSALPEAQIWASAAVGAAKSG